MTASREESLSDVIYSLHLYLSTKRFRTLEQIAGSKLWEARFHQRWGFYSDFSIRPIVDEARIHVPNL